MSETSFSEMMDSIRTSEENRFMVGKNWSQGRAAFGGLVAAAAVTAIGKGADDDKSIRSLMTNFIAPLPYGPASVATEELRHGKNVSQFSADVMSETGVAAHFSAAFGSARMGAHVPVARRSDLPERTPDTHLVAKHPFMPAFFSNFDIYWTGGGIPMSNTKDKTLSLWVRHREELRDHLLAKLVSIADMPPPILMSHYNRIVMGSSLSWSLEFVKNIQSITSEWFYLDFTLEAAADGYTQQSGRIYDETGELCMLSRQCMVCFE